MNELVTCMCSQNVINCIFSVFLTVGVPTIVRPEVGFTYLTITLNSLIKWASLKDRDDINIVILLADLLPVNRMFIKQYIQATYSQFLATGFVQVIEIPPGAYPPLVGLKRNFGDSDIRVTWRSKQAIDFSFLFYYSRNISDYYIQLEDDVVAAPAYFLKTKRFIEHQQKPWAVIKLCELGFIGKLFQNIHLEKLAMFFYVFYADQPVDWLYEHFAELVSGSRNIPKIKPSLFQHIGDRSSLSIKPVVPVRDTSFFGDIQKRRTKIVYGNYPNTKHPIGYRSLALTKDTIEFGYNPPAILFTDIEPYGDLYKPVEAYHKSDSYFWGMSIHKGQKYSINLLRSHVFDRIVVQTGNEQHSNDYLRNGTVYVCPQLHAKVDKECSCGWHFVNVANFVQGKVDVGNLTEKVHFKIRCVGLDVTSDQQEWLIIDNIFLYFNT